MKESGIMKKIGVLTWKLHNYGTALQAYALNKYLREKGFDCYLVNYSLEYKNLSRVNRFTLRVVIQKIVDRIRHKIGRVRLKQYENKYYDDIQLSKKRFNVFYDSIPHIGSRLINKENLWGEVKDCYAVICGSNQCWSPKFLDTSFYLDFVHNSIKKVAYAPSIAVESYTTAEKRLITPLLKRFDSISVREKNGQLLLNSMGFDQVELVVDPTLLLSKEIWNHDFVEAVDDLNKDYILVYFLSNNRWYENIVNIIMDIFPNYEIVVIPKTIGTFRMKGTLRCDTGPIEFVQLLRNSKYVITDSYHGMCLAIKYEIDFTIVQRFDDKKRGAENSRIRSLLNVLSIENRLVGWQHDDPCTDPIDWNVVSGKLLPLIQSSEEYLKKALGEDERDA